MSSTNMSVSTGSSKVVELKKASPSSKLGITLIQDDDGSVIVKGIDEGGIVCKSDINVGDKILSVNGVVADSHKTAASALRSSSGNITVIIEGEEGQDQDQSTKGDPWEVVEMSEDLIPDSLDVHKKESSSLDQCGCW